MWTRTISHEAERTPASVVITDLGGESVYEASVMSQRAALKSAVFLEKWKTQKKYRVDFLL